MVPREIIVLATLCVAASAAAAVPAASIDLAASGGDYELLLDERYDADPHDFPARNGNSHHHRADPSKLSREVRCFCNQPHCVSQGYMCRGRHGCFTELPTHVSARPEHAVYSGCLEQSSGERQCPQGKLCCQQDLCNHVDSPAMRSRLNKTLQVLLGEQRTYIGSIQPAMGQAVQTSDGWFKTATIAVPICGFVVLLILASLAIRLLQPIPSQGDKLNGLITPEMTPPLLGHHHHHHHIIHHHPNKLPLV
ncbi:BMP and activin membrane-bound inhibitor homolog [Phymastichus coffea]|uniref:BMP and activin membrane-bound inhibitor homolog n=1 Tax=Phymastichus coffea TaxID=108790 RepID=UPI00273C63C6|nr:BMP and activin membrane-bound inhibitor homolog [Phymastichus coffea]